VEISNDFLRVSFSSVGQRPADGECPDLKAFKAVAATVADRHGLAECYVRYCLNVGKVRHVDHSCVWEFFINRYQQYLEDESVPATKEIRVYPVQSDILVLGDD